ncbi:MAG: J domain-containing protein [Puniceicoccales bacterium]|jgi:hypothetical protein|nr:J domain-containing protein [Puniceicoccales bacterium]
MDHRILKTIVGGILFINPLLINAEIITQQGPSAQWIISNINQKLLQQEAEKISNIVAKQKLLQQKVTEASNNAAQQKPPQQKVTEASNNAAQQKPPQQKVTEASNADFYKRLRPKEAEKISNIAARQGFAAQQKSPPKKAEKVSNIVAQQGFVARQGLLLQKTTAEKASNANLYKRLLPKEAVKASNADFDKRLLLQEVAQTSSAIIRQFMDSMRKIAETHRIGFQQVGDGIAMLDVLYKSLPEITKATVYPEFNAVRKKLTDIFLIEAFKILGLPVKDIIQKELEMALRQKLEVKPGLLKPLAERHIFFQAADCIKLSDRFRYGKTISVASESEKLKDYAILGLKKGVVKMADLGRARKRELLKYHPDRFNRNKGTPGYECQTKEEATVKFQRIIDAYERINAELQNHR